MDSSTALENLPHRSRDLIEGDLLSVQNSLADLEGSTDATDFMLYLDSLEPNARDNLEVLISEAKGIDSIDIAVPEEYKQFITQYISQGSRLRRLQDELLPYLFQEYKGLVEGVLDAVDYDKVLDYYQRRDVNQEGYRGVSSGNLVNTLENLSLLRVYLYQIRGGAKNSLSFDEVNFRIEHIKRWQQEWQQKNYCDDQPKSDNKTRNLFGAKVTERRKKVIKVMENLMELKDLVNTYYHISGDIDLTDHFFDNLYKLLGPEYSVMTKSVTGLAEVDVDPRLLAAVARYIVVSTTPYKRAGILPSRYSEKSEKTTDSSLNESFGEPELIGFNAELDGAPAILKPEEIQHILALLPKKLRGGLLSLELASFANERLSEKVGEMGDSKIFHRLGAHEPVFDKSGKYVGAKLLFIEPFFYTNLSSGPFLDNIKMEFLHTLFHEVGHSTHSTLTLQEMKKWEEITKDGYIISDYVKRHKDSDERVGKREDFADSFATLITNPGKLWYESSTRFHYMLNLLLARYDNQDEKERFKKLVFGAVESYGQVNYGIRSSDKGG